MKGKLFITTALLAAFFITILPAAPEPLSEQAGVGTAYAFTSRILVRGSAGSDVHELQGRLKHLGYYAGRLDGVFGWQTYWSVRRFQQRFGLKVDGRVGSRTKDMLVRHTQGYTPPAPAALGTRRANTNASRTARQAAAPAFHTVSLNGRMSSTDLTLLTNAVNGEARGEPFEGQVAVAAVILNRLKSPLFPHTISGIIFQPGAFTAVQDGQIWLPPDPGVEKAVIAAIHGWDPSDGALYYFNPATATSKWIWSRPQIKQISHHIFCR